MNVRASPFAVEIMNNVLNNSAIVVVADGRKTCASRVARMYWAVRTVIVRRKMYENNNLCLGAQDHFDGNLHLQ